MVQYWFGIWTPGLDHQKGTNCLQDKAAKQVVKQPINTTKQTNKTVSKSMALVTNTAINTQHPVPSDNLMNINPFDFNTYTDLILCSHSVHNHMLPLLGSQLSDKPQFLLISVYSIHTQYIYITVQ